MSRPQLTPAQARVIASLYEKSITTPDYYPLTLKALTAACNQKSCRNPVMRLSEGEVGAALNDLEAIGWVRRDTSGRAVRWYQNLRHQLLLDVPSTAVVVTLMLRGPQTAAELRANAATLKGPQDPESLAGVLQRLGDGPEPLVIELPRAPGQKESRLAHTLCGTESALAAAPARSPGAPPVAADAAPDDDTTRRLSALERRVAELEARLDALTHGDSA